MRTLKGHAGVCREELHWNKFRGDGGWGMALSLAKGKVQGGGAESRYADRRAPTRIIDFLSWPLMK